MGYINVLYGGYKKVMKTLMYFSLPTKCFYEDILSNILHAIIVWVSATKVFACFN